MTHCFSQLESTQKKSPGGTTVAGWSLAAALPNVATCFDEEAEQEVVVEEERISEEQEEGGTDDGAEVAKDAASALARSRSSWEGGSSAAIEVVPSILNVLPSWLSEGPG